MIPAERLAPRIVYRMAKPQDLDSVVSLGLEALEKDAYPTLVVSASRCRDVARECISGAGQYCALAERDGVVVAALCAMVHPCLFYERMQASVVQFYSTVPGCGVRLIRDFLRWARARRGIKIIVFTLEARADPRIGKLLKRLGLSEELPVWMEVRG